MEGGAYGALYLPSMPYVNHLHKTLHSHAFSTCPHSWTELRIHRCQL